MACSVVRNNLNQISHTDLRINAVGCPTSGVTYGEGQYLHFSLYIYIYIYIIYFVYKNFTFITLFNGNIANSPLMLAQRV